MPLSNVAHFAVFTANPTVKQLEDQSVTPMFNNHPVELGLHERDDAFLKVIATDPVYLRLFPAAFLGDPGPYSFQHVRKGLAAFERTLISGNSPMTGTAMVTMRTPFRNPPNAARTSSFMRRSAVPVATADSPSAGRQFSRLLMVIMELSSSATGFTT